MSHKKCYIYLVKNYILLSALSLLFSLASCRKPRQGDFEMVLSGTKVTTNTNSSGIVVSTSLYSDTYDIHIKKSRKTAVEVGNMVWKRSGDKVSYTTTNLSFGAIVSGNWANGSTITTANTYDGTIKNNNSIEGNFVFTVTKIDGQGEEVQATTGTFILQRK